MNFTKTLKVWCIGAASLICACSSIGTDEPKATAPEVTASAPAEGEAVDPGKTEAITLTFSQEITVANPGHSFLTNTATGAKTQLAAGTVSGCRWTIPVTLDYGCSYELTLTGTTVKGKESGLFAGGFKLSFTTTEYVAPPFDSSKVQALINPKATPEAVRVHSFLKEQYGKKMLTGAMANVNNNNDIAEWMQKVSGKYPAMTFYDFIHIQESGQNWIDYSDITPAKTQWANNGLVGYMWHWRVPDTQEGEAHYEADFTFDIDMALTPGTWQNDYVEKTVKDVAEILKKLQDNNIPVLWRPLHEAAGDYAWGAWFWWGKQGVEKTKRLYIWLHDKLTNEYGLNNLIWVWTVQLYREGKLTQLSDLQSAYPGDEYVDIVGPDVYENTHDYPLDFFNMVNALVGGRKIVALPEAGMLPNPEYSFENANPWSYAMLWYTFDQHKSADTKDQFGNTNDYIKQWMASPLVITRDQMPDLKK